MTHEGKRKVALALGLLLTASFYLLEGLRPALLSPYWPWTFLIPGAGLGLLAYGARPWLRPWRWKGVLLLVLTALGMLVAWALIYFWDVLQLLANWE